MEQTFADLLRERAAERKGIDRRAVWIFVETSFGIMRENTMQHKHVVRPALATALLLLVPLVAMQFTDEVVWGLGDFVIMGALLFGTGFAYELITRKAGSTAYRAATGVALVAGLVLAWVNAAVGLLEHAFPNLIYLGVLAIGITGAVVTRLKPLGMARTLFAMALAHAVVAIIAVMIGIHKSTAPMFFIANGFFVALWLASASLFRSSTDQGPASHPH